MFNLVTKIATPLIAILVLRVLGPVTMNSYAIITNVMIFAELFRDAGVARMYLNEPETNEGIDRAYGTLAVGVSAVLALLLAGIAHPMSIWFNAPELKGGFLFAAVGVTLNGFSTLPASKLLRAARFREVGLAEAAGSVLSSIWALVLVMLGAGFWALASQIVVRSVIYLALTFRAAPGRVFGYDRAVYRRIAGAAGALTATNLLWVGFSNLDQLIVARLLGNTRGGFYGTGKMMVSSADVLAKPLMQTSKVAFARKVDDLSGVARTLHKSLMAFLIVVVPIYATVGILAKPLIGGILGTKFVGTAAVVPALCVYYAAIYPGSLASEALLMVGRPRVALYGWIATYAYLVLLLFIFARNAELAGLAWLFTSGLTLVNASTLFIALRQFPMNPDVRRKAGKAFMALVPTVAAAWACTFLPTAASQLLVAFLVVPCLHALALGMLFLENPASIFRPSGVKALWQRL